MTRFHNKVATSLQMTQRRISDDDLERPLKLSDNLERIEIEPARGLNDTDPASTLAETIADLNLLKETLRRGGFLRG